MQNLDIQKPIDQFKSIIEQKDLLYFYLLAAFILPFGLVYMFFYKEFPESIWILIFLTIITFLVFFSIFATFFGLNKGFNIKLLQKVETFFDTNIIKDFEGFKNDCSEITEIIEQDKAPYVMKIFVSFFKTNISGLEKIVSDLKNIKSELITARETIENAKILFKKFNLIIFASFILTISSYWIVHIFYELIITMNVFLIVYFLFFILLMFLEYLGKFYIMIQFYLIVFLYRLMIPLGRRYTIWFKEYTKNKVTNLSIENE